MPDKFNELLLKQDIIELYNAGITPDYGYLMNGRFEKDMIKTLYPLKSLSGNPISWEARDTEYLFPVVSLEPKQAGSGDPSPENVRPISGYDEVSVNVRGKNLFDANSGFAINGAASIYGFAFDGEFFKEGVTYSFSAKNSTENVNIKVSYAPYGEVNLDVTIPVGGSQQAAFHRNLNAANPALYIFLDTGGTVYGNGVAVDSIEEAKALNLQIEASSASTPYEPYQPGTTAALTLPETIYGGTVDAVTGLGEKTWAFVEFDGSEDENWNKIVHSSGRVYFLTNIEPYGLVSDAGRVTWKCNRLVPFVYNYAAIEYPEYSIGFNSQRSNCAIVLENESMLSVDEFKAWLAENPVTVCYKLATPEPFQATGNQALTIQPGNHTIYTDGNNISLSRKARRLEV